MIGLVAETDFPNLSRSRNVRFLEEVGYGDELLAALPKRAHTRPPVHLPDTWRQQEQNGPRVEKMVDTALAADLLDRARSDPHEWALILSEDDDMVPPAFTAEAWMKRHGGNVSSSCGPEGMSKKTPRKNIGGPVPEARWSDGGGGHMITDTQQLRRELALFADLGTTPRPRRLRDEGTSRLQTVA